MQILELPNGQIEAKSGNLTLTQTIVNGIKFNDCAVFNGEFYEMSNQHDERFKPLFIELHNFKVK